MRLRAASLKPHDFDTLLKMETDTMTTQTFDTTATFGADKPSIFAAPLAAFERYKAYRRTVSELEACSDRDLTDLGIYRCDIRRLARESIYGESA